MKSIFYILSIVFLLQSCIKDKDEIFIPTHADYPTNSLKSLIPSKSLDVKLSNNESHKLTTKFNSYIEVDKGAFDSESEGDIQYDLKVIELRKYVDYILQNVDHESSIGITNTIYSFYVSAEKDGNQLGFEEGKTIRVRFPHDKLTGELALGYGQAFDNSLRWEYFTSNINSQVEHIAWEAIDENGIMHIEYGYEIIINNSGWYSLVTKESLSSSSSSLCLSYSPEFNGDNTAAYLLMNDRKYITKLKMINDNSSTFCLNNLPATDQVPYTIISISKSVDGHYYYFEQELELGAEALEINVEPHQVNLSEIQFELETL